MDQDPRAAFAAALDRLRRRVPDVSDEALARHASALVLPSGRKVTVNSRRLGEWLNGQAVPRQFEPIMAVVRVIEKAVGGPPSATELQRLWRAAREQPARPSKALVLGRPPSDAAALRQRKELAAAVDEALADDAVDRVLLTGAGGMGKSQLASAAFDRACGAMDVLVWVPAATRQSVLSAYARAWRAKANGAGTDDTGWDDETHADLFMAWLRSSTSRWLVVLDDVDESAELSGLWPTGSTGRCLVTSRRRDAALLRPGTAVIPVGTFSPDEATDYLADRLAHADPVSADDIAALAKALGFFPLALSQAAAFLIDTGLGLPEYLELLADQRESMTDLLPSSSPADEHGGTVVSTVRLALERAEALAPAARPMLELISMLAPDGIPEEVVLGAEASRWLGTGAARANLLGLRALHRLSLVTHDASITAHSLVQRAVRDLVPEERRDPLAVAAADVLEEAWRAPGNADMLYRSAQVLRAVAGTRLWGNGMHPVLRRLSRHLRTIGRAESAKQTAEELLGQAGEPRDMLFLRGQVAAAVGELGNHTEAARMLRAVHGEARDALGASDEDTLLLRWLEAHYRYESGLVESAVEDLRSLVTEGLSVLGGTDPLVVNAREDLALCLGLSGDAEGARDTYAELERELHRERGPLDASRLQVLSGLGRWVGETGDAAAAVRTYEEAVHGLDLIFGRLHHETLVARHNLAYWRSLAGAVDTAIAEFETAARDAELGLGSEHPTTLTYRVNLAFWRGVAGPTDQALEELNRLREPVLRVFGAEHPRTLRLRQQYTVILHRSGATEEAVAQLTDLLAEMVRVQGANHPRTREAADLLAEWTS
ncbi:FxSxx-COOH system tetratricopeptide repeat protein [Actinophytocola sp.]|uniref:FxSxx-COOH system tetratricopeptide repeat protein n=1 Tax=Actinophytocola sp. TaxID=1872138 RepID=UPI002ED10CEB